MLMGLLTPYVCICLTQLFGPPLLCEMSMFICIFYGSPLTMGFGLGAKNNRKHTRSSLRREGRRPGQWLKPLRIVRRRQLSSLWPRVEIWILSSYWSRRYVYYNYIFQIRLSYLKPHFFKYRPFVLSLFEQLRRNMEDKEST